MHAPQTSLTPRINVPILAAAILAARLAISAAAAAEPTIDFTDRATWTPNSHGSGVQVVTLGGGKGFQVSFASGAQPTSAPPSFYPTQISGGYASAFALHGDFTVTLNYRLDAWPAENGVRVGIALMANLGLQRESVQGDRYFCAFGRGVPTKDLTGRLRLARCGDVLTGAYWNPATEAWVSLGSAQISGQDFQLDVGCWSDQSSFNRQPVKVTISSVTVTVQSLSPGPYPPNWVAPGAGLIRVPGFPGQW